MLSLSPLKNRILILAMLAATQLYAAPFAAFRDGESFTYKVGALIFGHAGEITITAHDDKKDGRDLVRVTTDIASRGFVRGLYAYDNHAEVVIDRATSRMQSVKESGSDPDNKTDTELVLDYAKGMAHYTDRVRADRSAETAIPPGDPIDLISALVQTRDWNLKSGEKRDILVPFGRDFYLLAIYADGVEEVRTPRGTYQAQVLIPKMEQNPKGMFKKGGQIKVWIAQDGSRLPVKMQLKLNFGSATLLLTDYKAAGGAAK